MNRPTTTGETMPLFNRNRPTPAPAPAGQGAAISLTKVQQTAPALVAGARAKGIAR